MKKNRSIWLTVIIFAIAMGLLEAVVVIYLRELYYPEGFSFPLKVMDASIATTELLRELATLVMLSGIAILAGKNGITRFAWFLLTFAIWDIFYYVFLKLLIGWPESLLTWDVLFLIPTTWVGPVVAPLINSMTMILLAYLLLTCQQESQPRLRRMDWILLISGSLLVLLSYMKEYTAFMLERFSLSEMFEPSLSSALMNNASAYVPVRFPWLIYLAGVVMHLAVIAAIIFRKINLSRKSPVNSTRLQESEE